MHLEHAVLVALLESFLEPGPPADRDGCVIAGQAQVERVLEQRRLALRRRRRRARRARELPPPGPPPDLTRVAAAGERFRIRLLGPPPTVAAP
ncbi:MAG TPA: hypothetical protein VFA45_18710 [Actinomycetes bacterium]|nr:hypothetical protein [Actinomycetes bacterium]